MSISVIQSTKNQEAYSTSQGMALKFPAAVLSTSTLVTILIGKKHPAPYQDGRTTGLDGSMDTNTPNPVLANQAGVTTGWTNQIALKSINAKTSAGTLFTDESVPTYSAEYPAVYIYTKASLTAGETILAKGAYKGPAVAGVADVNAAAGVSIFNGGVNAVALEIGGLATGVVGGSNVARTTTDNPALSEAGTHGVSDDIVIAAGYQKNGNVFSPSSGWTVIWADKSVGSQDHFVVAYKILSAAGAGSFANPLGYEMAVASIVLH